MADEQSGRLEGHINAAEYWLNQADIYDFPNPIRTECLQLASIHASVAQALALTGREPRGVMAGRDTARESIVCAACLTEACFAGILMCDDARRAGTAFARRDRED